MLTNPLVRILVAGAAVGVVLTGLVIVVDDEPGEPSRPPAHDQAADGGLDDRVADAVDDGWDERVAHLVPVVEDLRGLEFLAVTEVAFLPLDEFETELLAEQALTDEDRADAARAEGQLRALGLLDHGLDLVEVLEQSLASAVVGLYIPETERILVKGDTLDPFTESTVVHEMVHALQDQHFDLERLGESDDDGVDAMLQALSEGDATRIEQEWKADQGPAYSQAYDEAAASVLDAEALADIPDLLQAVLGAPYALGQPMTSLIVDQFDQHTLDGLLADPPPADMGLVDPLWLLDRIPDDGPWRDAPPVPALRPGEVQSTYDGEPDEGSFGALYWFMVVATAQDPLTAFDAVSGWAGDAYLGYQRDGVDCIRATFRAGDGSQADELASAVDPWARASSAQVERAGRDVTVDVCDRGTATEAASGLADAIAVLTVRSVLVSEIVGAGAAPAEAACFAEVVAAAIPPEVLAEVDASFAASDEFARIQTEAVSRCLLGSS